jgi:hypothetical protein
MNGKKDGLLLSEILRERLAPLGADATINLVRHKFDKRFMFDLIERGFFEHYQRVQNGDVFDCDYIVVFLGIESKKALFWNVYQVVSRKETKDFSHLPDFLKKKLVEGACFEYVLKPLEGFEDLHERLVIDWGNGQRIFSQVFYTGKGGFRNDKKVLEIRPKGFVKDFPGVLNFTLSHRELKALFESPDANRVWKDRLSVNGIYLILDTSTGSQYVGKANGKDGIWGRWSAYAETVHGGNTELKKLVENAPEYAANFQWTVLTTLPGNLSNEQVIEYENLFKEKLGSRAFGLNDN